MRHLEADISQQARSENFPVALRVLPRRHRRHLYRVYRYARYVDDVGDEATGDRNVALAAIGDDLRRLFGGGPVADPVVAQLRPTVEECDIPVGPLLRLVEANEQDQRKTRYESFDELVGYCRLSANPVGEIVLHIFGQVSAERVARSDRICTALQLIEHVQDIAEDRRRGRVYLPQEDLRYFGVPQTALDEPVASHALRALVAFEVERARRWLHTGAPLVGTLHGWGRLAVSGYLAGGMAAVTAVERSGFDPLKGPPRPDKRRVATTWAATTVRGCL